MHLKDVMFIYGFFQENLNLQMMSEVIYKKRQRNMDMVLVRLFKQQNNVVVVDGYKL